ncbi:MAG TPA: carboxypeptidase-like regulatory domain-containing protein [Parafilimonas sp.]|nr:carboxypeptidase-like regulatory domain-containing protein [Parafilimonas sp.]
MKKRIISKTKRMLLFISALLPLMNSVIAQNSATITGSVMNEKGEVLVGVTVKASAGAESQVAVTNEKGLFIFSNLKTGISYSITAIYVGYQQTTPVTVTPAAENNNAVLIRLEPDVKGLNEVVVTGYPNNPNGM